MARSHLVGGPLVMALFLASPAIAQVDPSAPASDPAVASDPDKKPPEIVVDGELSKKQKKVCMNETATGSIMSRRVCYTVAQLEERKRIAEYVKNELGKKQDRDQYTKLARDNR